MPWAGRRGNGEFNGDKVSVWEDEKVLGMGVPTVAQGDLRHTCSTRMQAGSLDLMLPRLQRRSKLQLGSNPWPGNAI